MEKFRINHDWGKAIVAAVRTESGIYAEAPVDAFVERLTILAIESALKSLPVERMNELSWSFKQETITGVVKDILTETLKKSLSVAVQDVIQELKDETIMVA